MLILNSISSACIMEAEHGRSLYVYTKISKQKSTKVLQNLI